MTVLGEFECEKYVGGTACIKNKQPKICKFMHYLRILGSFFILKLSCHLKHFLIAKYKGCTGSDVKQALQLALFRRQQFDKLEKPVIRTDNGPQFISHTFEELCEISELSKNSAKNTKYECHIESFHRIFEDDCCLSRWQFETYEEAYKVVTEFIAKLQKGQKEMKKIVF